MNFYKNLTLFFVVLFSFSAFADNPGDEPMQSAQVDEQEETVVAESETDDSTSDSSEDEDVTVLEKVVVTGSKIKRVQVEGALPLLVITKEDIDNAGFRNVTEALQTIPSVNQYTQNESITNGFTPNANELDLRNLGPGRVLYLINGRRTADYPIPYNNASNFVNISTIPTGLVDRIEVLSQGASAIYGSDAISGVVNIITRKGLDYSEVDVGLIEIENGNVQQASFTFTTGGFFGSSSWTFGVDRTEVDPMYYSDIPGNDSFLDDPDTIGVKFPRLGMYMRTGSTYDFDQPTGGTTTYGPPFLYSSSDFGVPCTTLSSSFFDMSFDPNESLNIPDDYFLIGNACGHDYGGDQYGGTSPTLINEREDTTVMATFNHTFESGVSFEARAYHYEDISYLRSEVNRSVFLEDIYDPWRISAATDNSLNPTTVTDYFSPCGFSITAAATIPACAGTVPESATFMDTFYREFSSDDASLAENRSDYEETLDDFFVGVNGFFPNGFEWAVGVNYTEYELVLTSQTLSQSINEYFAGAGATLANTPNGDTGFWNAYGLSTVGADGLLQSSAAGACGYEALTLSNGVSYNNCLLMDRLLQPIDNDFLSQHLLDDSLQGLSDQTTVDFTVNGEFEAFGKFIGFAASVDHQEQSYDLTPSAGRLDPNVEYANGSTIDGNGDRQRTSLGVEFAIPVTNKLEVNIASRVDSYDDDSSNVGMARSNMFSFAWRPNTDWLIRGSGSETFRAPDMNYLFQAPSSGFIGATDYVRCYDGVQSYIEAGFFTELGTYLNWNCNFFGTTVRGNFQGNIELEEETGENMQLGVVWEANNNLTFYVDLYDVRIENAVSRESTTDLILLDGFCRYGQDFLDFMTGVQFPSRSCDDLGDKLVRGPQIDPFGQPFDGVGSLESVSPNYINQSFLEYQGVDWQMRYSYETQNAGDFIVNVLSSHIITSSSQVNVDSAVIDDLDTYIYQPRSQQNMSLSWLYQDWSAYLFADRTGHMEVYRGQTSDPHILVNLSVGYDYSADLDMYIGVRNIEDKGPQVDPGYGWPFYNQGVYSAIGRYWSAGFNYRF